MQYPILTATLHLGRTPRFMCKARVTDAESAQNNLFCTVHAKESITKESKDCVLSLTVLNIVHHSFSL